MAAPLIAPSILSADMARLGEEARALEEAGADWLHLDIMDGHFVPNLTFGAGVVGSLRSHSALYFDAHLMTDPVDPLIDAFADAGVQGITFHPEVGNHPHRTLQRIAARGLKAGLSLNPGSSLSRVQPMIGDIDLLLIMTVNPGFGGQRLIASQLEKIAEARSMIDAQRNAGGRPITLQVDGGVAAGTARSVIEAGATCLVAGTAVFSGGADHYADNIATLRNAGGDTETGC